MDLLQLSFVNDLLTRDFLQYALISGILIGLITPILGCFVVIRRLSLIADTLSHVSLAGIYTGLFITSTFGITFISNPLYMGVFFSILGGIFIEILRGHYKNYKEISMPIVMSCGTALSALFISLSGGYSTSLLNYLFGSIMTVREDYLMIIIIITVVILLLVTIYYKQLLAISFDVTNAKLIGIKVGRIQIISTIILATVIALSIEIVGVLLVSSLMIIPVATAMKLGTSFKSTMIIAISISEFSVLLGIFLAYVLGSPSGATIVIINIIILIVVVFTKKIFEPKKRKKQIEGEIKEDLVTLDSY